VAAPAQRDQVDARMRPAVGNGDAVMDLSGRLTA
jgi:hypothetical protein